MKKVLLLSLIWTVLFACKKSDSTTVLTQNTSGTLIYESPASDGAGLYFKVDGMDEILTFNPDAQEDPHTKYQAFIGVHTNLFYTDTGKKTCLSTMVGCVGSYRIVNVISLEKD